MHKKLIVGFLAVLTAVFLWSPAKAAVNMAWDIDGNGKLESAYDGLLVIRYISGLTGDTLTLNALGQGATRNASTITTYLNGLKSAGYLDADGNSFLRALSDGILISRYMDFAAGAVDTSSTRSYPGQIATFLDSAKASKQPTISSVSPASSTAGGYVTVYGSGFYFGAPANSELGNGAYILLDSGTASAMTISPTTWSDTTLNFAVPAGVTIGSHSLRIGFKASDVVTNAVKFEVLGTTISGLLSQIQTLNSQAIVAASNTSTAYLWAILYREELLLKVLPSYTSDQTALALISQLQTLLAQARSISNASGGTAALTVLNQMSQLITQLQKITTTSLTWDIDGNKTVDSYDANILMAYMGFPLDRMNPTLSERLGPGATRTTVFAVTDYLNQLNNKGYLDADGNGKVDMMTDGILIARYINKTAITTGMVFDAKATRTTDAAIKSFLDGAPTPTAPIGKLTVKSPGSLLVGQTAGWTIMAKDPQVAIAVSWGDGKYSTSTTGAYYSASLAHSYAAPGTYTQLITSTWCTADCVKYDVASSVVTVTGTATTLTVLSPNGGENITPGTLPIRWSSTGSASTVNIQLLQNGNLVTSISPIPNTGSYTWAIPTSYTGTGFKVKIWWNDVSDESNATFNIGTATTNLPDLALSVYSWPTSVPVNQPVLLKLLLQNKGTVSAYPALYSYLYQAGGVSSLDPSNTCTATTRLGPGQSCDSAYKFTFSTPGIKTMTVKADPQNQLVESNELNNETTFSVNVVNSITTPATSTISQPVIAVSGPKSLVPGQSGSWSVSSASSIYNYSVNWGDGTPASTQTSGTFNHIYGNAGTYYATFSGTSCTFNTCGTGKTTLVITVSSAISIPQTIPQPVIIVSGPKTLAPNQAATWKASSTSPISNYSVNWGDGTLSPAQTSGTFSHVYPTVGTYTATFSGTSCTFNACGTGKTAITITVAASTAAPTIYVAGPKSLAVKQVGSWAISSPSSISNYSANWGDGSSSPAQAYGSFTHAYATAGTYIITFSGVSCTFNACNTGKTNVPIAVGSSTSATSSTGGSFSYEATTSGETASAIATLQQMISELADQLYNLLQGSE